MANSRVMSTSVGTNREAFAPRDWALFLGVSLIWGSSFLLISIGLEAIHPGTFTLIRVGLGAAALALFPQARTRIEATDRPRLYVLSVVWVALPFTLFPLAQQYINSAVTGMLNGATPIFAAIVAAFLLRRAPRAAQLVGLVVGFAGVVLISLSQGTSDGTQALGVVLTLTATVCYGFSVNIAAPLTQRYGSVAVMAKMLALATIWTAPFGLWGLQYSGFEWGPVLAGVAAGVIGTGFAFAIMASLVSSVGSTRASFITYLIPVIATMLGVALLGDDVGVLELIGIALTIGGAFMASLREGGRHEVAPDPTAIVADR